MAAAVLTLGVPAEASAQDESAEASEVAGDAAAAADATEKEGIVVGEDILDLYIGKYELAPGFVIDVTREGEQLFIQATNQPRFEVYAESETRFYLTVVDAQVEFHQEGTEPAESMTLFQNGQAVPGPRVE